MPVPPLRIPVALDMDALNRQTQAASDRVGETLKGIGRAFTKLNGELVGLASNTAGGMALAWGQGAARSILSFAAIGAGAVAAFKLIEGAIGTTLEKLEEMVEVADKSRNALVSATFFQSFVAESKKLKVSVEDLQGALTSAFSATKGKAPIDLEQWETGEERITSIEKALRVYNETMFRAQGGRLEGLVLFRDAETQEQKIVAVLRAMIQLQSIGQNLAALDVGEKMFGVRFVDNIRQGRTSAEEMLKTIEQTRASGRDIFPDELVKRAKEVDDQLKVAQQRLEREMRPTFEGLANQMLTIKSLWAQVVDLIAQAVSLVGRINFVELAKFAANPAAYAGNYLAGKVTGTLLNTDNPAVTASAPGLASAAGINDIATAGLGKSRGTGDAPTKKTTTSTSSRDRFDASADSIEKRTAALDVESRTLDLNAEARERARVAAELQTVAMQVNKEAGLGENVVTAEQQQRIDAVAEAYGRAAGAIARAREPLQTFARESANVGRALNQFAATSLDGVTNALADVVTGTRSAADAFRALANSVINDLARIAIRQAITGPIAGLLGGLSGAGGFRLPGFAGGTDSAPGGLALVGERGPEIVNLPRGAQVIPNDLVPSLGGRSGVKVSVTSVMHFESGISGTDMAQIAVMVQQANRETEARVYQGLRSGVRDNPHLITG